MQLDEFGLVVSPLRSALFRDLSLGFNCRSLFKTISNVQLLQRVATRSGWIMGLRHVVEPSLAGKAEVVKTGWLKYSIIGLRDGLLRRGDVDGI